MAARIAQAGHDLHVFDAISVSAERFCTTFPAAVAAASAAAAAKQAEIVIAMLPSSNEVEAVTYGSPKFSGVISSMRPGALFIDMSSSEPLRSRSLAASMIKAGLEFADAPVSGGAVTARNGSLTIMFGGTEDALRKCRSVLDCIGSTIFHTGPVGSGHAMKALNNFVSAAGLVAAVEALHVGEKFGLDPALMTKILNASTGKNNTTENKVAQFMLSGSFDSGFALPLMTKDIGIAVRLAEALGVPIKQGAACYELWLAAQEKSRSADHTEMYRLMD
jgi:3-hydroxyisobutyrate dehydrogenase